MADNNDKRKRDEGGSQADLNLPALLANLGKVVSPEGSVGERVGEAAGTMAGNEQDRRFLSQLLGGQRVPKIRGQLGLNPETVLEGVKTRAAITPEPPEPMVPVTLPNGRTVQVPQSEAADYERKVWAEQHTPEPTSIREFRTFQNMDEETQKDFLKFSKTQRGKTFEETLAEFLAKQEAGQRQRHKVEQELELGTPEHLNEIRDSLDEAEVNKFYGRQKLEGREISYSGAKEVYAIQSAAKAMTDNFDQYRKVFYTKRGEKGPGFYGIKRDGTRELVQRYTPQAE